jgi:hypothetical protein
VGEGNVEELLQVPFYFMEQLMMKTLELVSCLEERLRRHKMELGDYSNDNFINLLSILEIEAHSLQGCLGQLNSIVLGDKD